MADILDRAKQIMDDAVDKAGDLLCSKPRVAEVILKQLLKCDPEHLGGLQLLGLCKHRMGDNAEAVEIIRTALELDPNCADNHNNLALAYAGLGENKRAVEHLQKALSLKPGHHLFMNNLALQYRVMGEYDKAVATLEEAVRDHDVPQMWCNLGGIHHEMRNTVESKRCFRRAMEADPDHAAAHVDMAFAYHLAGQHREGFEEYEWRFRYYPQMQFYLDAFDQTRRWDGRTDPSGKRFLIYGEQGLGDIIMFARYCKELHDRGAHVTLHCPASLDPLLRRQEGIDATNNRDIVGNSGEPLPDYDCQFSMMSFPHLLGHPPVSGKPYLTPVTDKFRSYISGQYGKTFNVGVVWAGSPAHPHDRRRSIPLRHFRGLHDVPGVKLFSLQLDMRRRQYGATVQTSPDADPLAGKFVAELGIVDYTEGCEGMSLVDLSPMIQTMEDTATIIAGLDLVITCDTAIVHLAGALGVPCWAMIPYNPDWRWGLEGEKTPWYDSVRLLRQSQRDDWESVFTKAAEELHATVLQAQR